MNDRFSFDRQLFLIGPSYMDTQTVRHLTRGFTFGECEIVILPSDEKQPAFALSDSAENATSLLPNLCIHDRCL